MLILFYKVESTSALLPHLNAHIEKWMELMVS